MREHDEQLREPARQEAADWFIANREGLDSIQQAAFMRWLRASPVHVQEYLGMALTARDVSAAAAVSPVSIESLLPHARGTGVEAVPIPRHRSGAIAATPAWRFAAVAAALAGLLAVGFAWWVQDYRARPPGLVDLVAERYSTRHGQRLTRHLYDGSTVHLNTDTAVSIDFGAHARQITIERGQATFEVAHDPQRPFRVITPAAEVVALGTNFDVYMRPDSTLITVVAGRVSVVPGRAQQAAGAERGLEPLVVSAGQQLRVTDGAWPGTLVAMDVQQATAWLRGRVSFTQQPLGAVAAEFTRYAAAPIVIETPALRAMSVSGNFAADDTGAFIAFLRSLEGVHVEVTPARTRVWQ